MPSIWTLGAKWSLSPGFGVELECMFNFLWTDWWLLCFYYTGPAYKGIYTYVYVFLEMSFSNFFFFNVEQFVRLGWGGFFCFILRIIHITVLWRVVDYLEKKGVLGQLSLELQCCYSSSRQVAHEATPHDFFPLYILVELHIRR